MEQQHGRRENREEALARRARGAAQALVRRGTIPARRVSAQIRTALGRVRRSYERTAAWAAGRQELPRAAEWLLDNWYLAQREGLDGAAAFRRAGALPAAEGGAAVMALARAAVEAGALDVEGIAVFLAAVQAARPMEEKELSLFVPALKGALTERLARLCQGLTETLPKADADGAPEGDGLAASLEGVFTALRLLAGANLGPVLEEASQVERLLRQDPAGVYPKMDEVCRARYRHEVCRQARRSGRTEREMAEQLLLRARQGEGPRRHVGWYLFREPLGRPAHTARGTGYLAAVTLPTLFLVLLAGFTLHTPLVVALLLLPVSDLVKNSVDFLAVRLFRPRYVYRLDLRDGVPAEGKTLCVIASLLTGEESGRELAGLLERYRLANRGAGEQLLFGVLADLPDSGSPMGEKGRAAVAAARRAVEELNGKYGSGFYLLFRAPAFQRRDERYMGWERKRGALLELARLLRGRPTALRVEAGRRRGLEGVRFVITLDGDTRLNVGAAAELIGAMLHPLNRPEVDRRRRVVTAGYGVLQPRVGVELEAANHTQFSRIFAGQGGVDPYGAAASDVYHDLFDQATYTGKGIFDVDAYLACLDGRFPENRVLSHDLLEGSYLRAGLIGDVELTDGYPSRVTGYFARLHRWVRGDWQLLPWLGRRVRDEAGRRVDNPISPIAKWKIFDNLRRSLSPVCTLLALLLGMCVSGVAFGAAAGAAVLAAASNLLLSGADLALRLGRGVRMRYHSTIIAGFGGVVLQTLVQLLFLPYQAWTCLSAVVTALWRSLVTRRGLLAWVTAADTERAARDGIWAQYRKQWCSVLVGAAAMAWAILPAGAAVGLVWALSPVCAWAMSRPIRTGRAVSPGDRAFLLHQAGLIWRYFSDFLRPEDHWLPPDNYQEQPPVGLARRTSPTNIGLALLSVLAAVDLELLPRRRAAALLGHMMDTLEALPKWNGHLYNWYDTAAAQPLRPRYVSTVDSGNLCACLIALREGLYEWGEGELARRAERLSDDMGFAPLYDRERRLFYIGYDVERGAYTQGWYDLMASEARQTSYLAVARGEVSPRHWRRLGRTLVKENDYCGMASWTGTMFEYFMPNLLLPCEPNSLMYESLAFCVYAQRRRGARCGVPWGISESGFYAFDPGMSYQYKAHGVQTLGLKRGLDAELVVSPYSSFLALLLSPGRAAENLRRLRDMGLEGRYGLYEAVDFTPARQSGGAGWEIVRSFMAHHLGMSLVAIDNALLENRMQERFLRDCSMSAYRELLQEKVPVGAAVPRPRFREVPEKPRRSAGPRFLREGTSGGEEVPACHLLSNGSYTVLCTAQGAARAWSGPVEVTLGELEQGARPAGVSFFFRDKDGRLYPFTEKPLCRPGGHYAWRFAGGEARWTAAWGELLCESLVRLGEGRGELREAALTWRGEGTLEGELVCYLEPVLAPLRDYRAHPAFSKLMVESRELGEGVQFRRRARGGEGERHLAVLWSESGARFETARETALGRGGLRALEQRLEADARGTTGAVLDPCLLLRVPVELKRGARWRLRLALGLSERARGAVLEAQRLLCLPERPPDGRLDGLLQRYNLTSEFAYQAFHLLEGLVFPDPAASGSGPVASQPGLWAFGISGDLPLAVLGPVREGALEGAVRLLQCHALLAACGFSFDAVLLLQEGGDYRRPVYRALSEALRTLGAERQLGRKGGVHLVEAADGRDLGPLLAGAAVRLPAEGEWVISRETALLLPLPRPEFRLAPGLPEQALEGDGTFRMHTRGTLPPLGWSQILANPRFGWMADETGCGHLWYQNARENPLTPWENDPLEVGGGEGFFLAADGVYYSLFADGDGLDCSAAYRPGFAVWKKRIGGAAVETRAFVPPETPARVLQIDRKGGAGGARLVCRFRPQLTPERDGARFAEIICKGNYLVIQNPWNRAFWPQSMLLCASGPIEAWRRGRDGAVEVVWTLEGELTVVTGCASSRAEEAAVLALADPERAGAAERETRAHWDRLAGAVTVETPDRALDGYLNGWAPYQVAACRLWGRTSRYQSGGAYGFRDQLQDGCAALLFAPELARTQILRACAHQFEAGDVQHWWHETLEKGPGRGVRTRISDDLLWLPYALCEYLEKTGDRTILAEQAPYLRAPELAEGEGERYERPEVSPERGTVLEHAVRAVERVLARGTGAHGLLLMGSGDWNDGMNRVGERGGESVWLTWFAAHVLDRLAPVAEAEGGSARAAEWRSAAEGLRAAAERAWDGGWFLRGYYGDGAPLGSRENTACRIDSIAQSWAVLAGCGDALRAEQGVRAALEQLWDREHRLVRLFTPPFDGTEDHDPGYIRGYVPGVRENGGQYTHAAVWLARACLRLGMAEEGWRLLHDLLPSGRDTPVYRAEPYVLAADVYDNPQHPGRGGWSWYTGAAGWFYRTALEELLGLRLRQGELFFAPRLPESWPGYTARWRTGKAELEIQVRRGPAPGVTLDGTAATGGIRLAELRGRHQVVVTL